MEWKKIAHKKYNKCGNSQVEQVAIWDSLVVLNNIGHKNSKVRLDHSKLRTTDLMRRVDTSGDGCC